jgi:hypothetical protein
MAVSAGTIRVPLGGMTLADLGAMAHQVVVPALPDAPTAAVRVRDGTNAHQVIPMAAAMLREVTERRTGVPLATARAGIRGTPPGGRAGTPAVVREETVAERAGAAPIGVRMRRQTVRRRDVRDPSAGCRSVTPAH